MMLSVQISEGIDAIGSLAGEWDALIPSSSAAAFSSSSWYQAWYDAFHPGEVAFVTARDGTQLAGVLPLARIRTDERGLYLPLVAPFALGDYQPFLVDRSSARRVFPAMLDAAIGYYGRRGVYWWPHIPAGDPSLDILRDYFNDRGMPYVEERETAPRLHIGGRDYAEVERCWNASVRGDIRRQRRRLAEQGPVSLWMPSTIAEAETALAEFFDVHDAKWLEQGKPGRFQNPVERAHFLAILRRFHGRGLHFSTLRCGDVNVSYHFGLLSGRWLLYYRPSYRTEYARFSPSKVHVSMLIEEGCRAGWEGFDFLLGEEPYKYYWSNDEMEVVNIHSGFHEWAPSYFWFSRGKPLVRRKFQGAYMRVQAWRQKWSLAAS